MEISTLKRNCSPPRASLSWEKHSGAFSSPHVLRGSRCSEAVMFDRKPDLRNKSTVHDGGKAGHVTTAHGAGG